MVKMYIMELPNRETSYFSKHIDPWIADEKIIDQKSNLREIVFKKGVPVDIINKFLICRPKLDFNYSNKYKIEQ